MEEWNKRYFTTPRRTPWAVYHRGTNRAPVPTFNTMFLHSVNNSAISIEQWKMDASSLAAIVTIGMEDENVLRAVPLDQWCISSTHQTVRISRD